MDKAAFFQALLVFLVISLLVLTFFAKTYPFFAFDPPITKILQQFNPWWFDFSMKLVSSLGDRIIGTISILIFVLIFLSLRRLKLVVLIVISAVGAQGLASIFKTLIARPRPDPRMGLDSFPSGHVLFFVGLYGFLLFLVLTKFKKGFLKKGLIFVLSTLLLLIGISRIYLGVHWFSDVLGGYLFGLIWLYVVIKVDKLF